MIFDNYPIILDLCKILIPSFITYLVTKYSIMHSKIYAIREKQFNLVYLPLYILNRKYENSYSYFSKAFVKKATSIINKNFQYTFTDTIELLDNIQNHFSSIKNEDDEILLYFDIIIFSDNINNNYSFLKKYLGYPTKSPFDIMKRNPFTFKNVFLKATLVLFPFLLISSILLFIYSFTIQNWTYSIIFAIVSTYLIYDLIPDLKYYYYVLFDHKSKK